MICIKLLFINNYNEKHYFVSFGADWPHKPELRLIGKTTTDPDKARCFPTSEKAMETLKKCGEPLGWSILAEETKK